MPEYIEREALIAELEEELAFDTPMYTDKENKFINRGLMIAIKDVNSIPIADVVEVVRCKDCGSYNKHYGECTRNGSHLGEDGFCSRGKRKEVNNV